MLDEHDVAMLKAAANEWVAEARSIEGTNADDAGAAYAYVDCATDLRRLIDALGSRS